ncbi:MAG TPA: glycosyltransferase family 4 protein [Mycobacteriales bacterium]|nr:glycosyltransferase family 4 protein [Mycobacteriales bacterium]
MKVLVVHNRYVSAVPSGENAVVDEETASLREAGVDVVTHLRSSDEIAALPPAKKAALALRPLRSGEDAAAVRRLIRETRPDVLHLHNPYPLVSPWVIRVAHGEGVPVVQTVHNYRHGCIAGSFFRDGHPCEDCLGHRTLWPGVVHGCYRGSRPQSAVLAAAENAHRGTWRSVDAYLALTAFAKTKLVAAGLPADRIVIRPNTTPDPGEPRPPGEGVLFVGRLDEEKGVPLLLAAARLCSMPVTVVGSGRYADAAATAPNVTYLGPRTPAEVAAAMTSAAAVVIPSVCYEGMPRVLVEAYARARPVVATAVGPLPELVPDETGWTAAPTPEALAAALDAVTPEAAAAKGAAARARYLATMTPERTMTQLLDLYRSVASR